ncbi:MAG: CBS domain-containing protein [Nitrospirae bacterium]|nr:CBS domain-containing protein [Nitrospirota bacterium]
MFVSDWMTKKVFTISPDDSVTDAIKLMKENKIKHLPVLKNDRLKGIISDRDIKEFSPSKATTLDMYELHYLLAKARVKDLMRSKVTTTMPDTPVEEAAMLMHDQGIGCLPVVESGRLAGIISDMDIYHALVDITGARHGGNRIFLTIEDTPGSIKDVADIIRKHGFRLQSILTSYEGVKAGFRDVVLRTKGNGDFKNMKMELEGTFAHVKIRKG